MEEQKNEHIFGGGGKPLLEIWKEAWGQEVHETEYAKSRIKSAKSAKMTPIKIDKEDYYGYFQGSHGRYETFLDSCPCGDFIRNRLPCKHIYRLAIELGLMNEDVKADKNAIPTPKAERKTLDEQIDAVESLSEEAQQRLLGIAASVNSNNPTYQTGIDEVITELMEAGVIVDAAPEEHKIRFGSKAEIVDLLQSENIEFRKQDKVGILREICIEQIPQKAKEVFGEIISVSIPTEYSPQQIHFYLHRKYDYEYFYDENMVEQKVKLTDRELPIDAITDQLIKRGYYTKK